MTEASLAPPGQVGWSGQNWYRTSRLSAPTIQVLEPKSPSYDEYAERKARAGERVKVPFGFSLERELLVERAEVWDGAKAHAEGSGGSSLCSCCLDHDDAPFPVNHSVECETCGQPCSCEGCIAESLADEV